MKRIQRVGDALVMVRTSRRVWLIGRMRIFARPSIAWSENHRIFVATILRWGVGYSMFPDARPAAPLTCRCAVPRSDGWECTVCRRPTLADIEARRRAREAA